MAKISTNKQQGAPMSASQNQITDMIRKKAYELYEKRGRKLGHAMEDWLEAERLVKQRKF